ncbi:MAG: hypothetical protein WDN47_04825 [Candidatus Doudnabacteria bacterium]
MRWNGIYSVLAVLAVMLWLQWKTYSKVSGRRRFREGDIVLYVNPESDDMNNMITKVLHVFHSHGTVQIRGKGTTVLVSASRLQILNIDTNAPMQVPEEPIAGDIGQGEKTLRWNQAKFRLIPLSWFDYLVPAGATPVGEYERL